MGDEPPQHDRATEPAKFGITARTRKHVELQGSRLSRAINGLAAHQVAETDATSEAAFAALTGATGLGPQMDPQRLADIAARRRNARGDLLSTLERLRDPVLDAIADAHTLLPANALRLKWIEPESTALAPRPLATDLTPIELIKVLHDNLGWSRSVSSWLALEAFAASSALAPLIEWPTPEATDLSAGLDAALIALPTFILREA